MIISLNWPIILSNNNNNNNFTYTSVPTRPRGPPNYRN